MTPPVIVMEILSVCLVNSVTIIVLHLEDMSPQTESVSINNNYDENKNNGNDENAVLFKGVGTDYKYKHIVYWPNAIFFLVMHLLSLWGLWMIVSGQTKCATLLWGFVVLYGSTEGITIGAHRLYTHKSFKAKLPLRCLLVLLQTVAGQNSMYTWVRDHRLHHRYSDTDADPHNSKRGFFFSHMGWLMCKKHPMVHKLGPNIDMSDLEADPLVMFQKEHFMPLYIITSIVVPVAVPIYFFEENWLVSLMVAYVFRYIFSLNGAWTVNSFAHLYGTRPYDKNLQPVESWFVSFISSGEGWHNYHHAYPWDYKASELGMHFNPSAMYIEWFEKLGLAYDLKKVPDVVVKSRVLRTGDGTHHNLGSNEACASVTAPGFIHPINPWYSSGSEPEVSLDEIGLPLTQDDAKISVKMHHSGTNDEKTR